MKGVGLLSGEALARRSAFGPNEIAQPAPRSRWALAAAQMKSPLVWLLLGACAVSGAVGQWGDAIAIGVIMLINAVVGFLQEARAEHAIRALRDLTAPRACVVRDGARVVLPAADVVPGDVLVLAAGDLVAADARLLEAHALRTNEATLTGESLPVAKRTGTKDDQPDADRLFMGTAVSAGSGVAEVTATGMGTRLGSIARLIETASDEPTPLQQRLARVGRMLLLLCLGAVAVTALGGLLQGQPPFEVFFAAVSLAVAAVPEGLPAVVTVALAVGVQRMTARNVLVRRLPGVETLGNATVICTDKTGTLTTGVMAVRELWGPDHDAVVRAAAACCDAELGGNGRGGTGDPTELAILAEAFDRGIFRQRIEDENPRLTVTPFDTSLRRMAVRRADGVVYVKGAPEAVLPLCAPSADHDGAARATTEMGKGGYRVLAVAAGSGPDDSGMRLVGLIGIADPPRKEAVAAVAAARAAGVRTIMITGDHPGTAAAVAREMGIVGPGDDAAALVHARATPEDKLRIVREWKARGAIVAMTGDGVNDAPALREAHVGIAMGRTGTEVTRQASDLVLADDNYASIVAAMREGRGIFDNIRKTLVYLLAGNTGEVLVMLGAALLALPSPLLPIHLLWINLVTDGMPALALVMDPAAPDVMDRPPRPPAQPMLGRREWTEIVGIGLLEAAIALGVFVLRRRDGDLAAARTLAFSTLVFCELCRVFTARSATRLFWQVGALSNLRLVVVVTASMLAQIAVVMFEPSRRLFQLAELSPREWLLTLVLGLVPVSVLELRKLRGRLPRLVPSEVQS
ncbi:MAG TPA: cation-translocating P-type ATPase [Polyangia bacterium]|nr:cation-translocating P-type ATPase [Polyangia bacterium]